ncbi:exo-alpha-sialidase [Algoriphagus sp. Y33]|uniref:sialidase family protein n=1 Tax=Algoriphagus sp. Y33 TaxID=2772483 RepID=UPI001786B923|nr:sialidase family protein [Algoriphagus sp. Y33]
MEINMRSILIGLGTLLFPLMASAQQAPNDITGNYYLPPVSKPGEGALLKSELIYGLDNRPTPEVHASTLIETPEGIVSAFFGGTHENNPDVGIRISHLVNGEWTWPEEIVNGVQNDTLRYPCWNPVLFQPEGKPLMLFYKVGPSPTTWWGMLTTSTDNGKTWTTPTKLGEDPEIGHIIGPVKNKPVQLKSGRIINPTSLEYIINGNEQDWMVYFEISDDGGDTWEMIGPVHDGVEFDAIQPSILTYPDGKIQAISRTKQGVLSQIWSEDEGETWGKMTALTLPNPNSGTDAVTLADGRQLLVYNHSTKEGNQPNGRNILNLAISENGQDWKPVMTFENEPIEDGYAYPSIIQASDGLVHITYTYNRRSVKYAVIDPNKL